MDVRFWGGRGSVAVSGPSFAGTGGNTTCVELVSDGWRLVFDGGTGLAALGAALGPAPVRAAVLFTHVHWDHIQGVPFFSPLWNPGSELVLGGRADLRDVLDRHVRPPTFPLGLDAFRARIAWHEVTREPWEYGPFRVTALAAADHPDGVLVYRAEANGRAVVFATDVEHGDRIDPAIVDFARGADLLVHDAQYDDAEYASRRGWGHSTWAQAVAVAEAADVGRLGLFHHDPARTDGEVARFEAAAAAARAGTFAAREHVGVAA
jgi:phosphoribosyl 1,2-cyclic phosphodiesterase